MILPGTGRGTMRSMVEGYRRVVLTARSCDHGAYPSTTYGGPPPRAEEEL
jgi:hypothetical protein